MGKATFSDTFWFENTYQAEVLQYVSDPTIFCLVNPYAEGLEAEGFISEGYYSAGPDEYVYFYVLQPGDVLFPDTDYEVTVSGTDLVYYNMYYTGVYYPDYAAEVLCVHPAHFTSTATEEFWSYNRVLSYQENGLPAVVQFAPVYYMMNVGGWNQSQADGLITIEFPVATTGLQETVAGTWSVSGADRMLRIAGTDAEAAVYDITGHLVYRGTDRAINVPATGIYMVRIGAETKRAIIK